MTKEHNSDDRIRYRTGHGQTPPPHIPRVPLDICPNCGNPWESHVPYKDHLERVCYEDLLSGATLRIHYTSENTFYYAQAFLGDEFLCQFMGNNARSRCKAHITRMVKADRGELPMPEPMKTPPNFIEHDSEW